MAIFGDVKRFVFRRAITPNPLLQADEALNDSDKSFTVPSDQVWRIQSIRAELTTTATAGTRQMTVEIQDGAGDVLYSKNGGTAAASTTLIEHYAPVGGEVAVPDLILPPNFVVRVFDSAAIDPAADDLVVQMLVKERANV